VLGTGGTLIPEPNNSLITSYTNANIYAFDSFDKFIRAGSFIVYVPSSSV
jgi:hypothetical protein